MWQPELLSDMVHSNIMSGVAAGHMISQDDKQLLVNWNNKWYSLSLIAKVLTLENPSHAIMQKYLCLYNQQIEILRQVLFTYVSVWGNILNGFGKWNSSSLWII